MISIENELTSLLLLNLFHSIFLLNLTTFDVNNFYNHDSKYLRTNIFLHCVQAMLLNTYNLIHCSIYRLKYYNYMFLYEIFGRKFEASNLEKKQKEMI